ncbi:MAG: hypothetical protein JO112_18175, partial [Planctomycetes bacterium]|nr:hypothetical protein [Planctomycetota bacterium]
MKISILSRKFSSLLVSALIGLTVNPGSAQQTFVKRVQGSHWVGTWAASAQAIDASTMPPAPPGLA